jgi:MFS transporter, DHA3 family, macrolide efflux protein
MTGVFSNRSFLLLLSGSVISQIGSQLAFVATIFWLRQTTDSASLLGLSATITALPLLLLSPLGGVFADRWSRRRILIVCDIICCLVCLSLMFFSGKAPLSISLAIAGVFASNLLLFSCIAFSNPAIQALLPDIVEPHQLERAIGVRQASGLIAMIGGQALGALLLSHYSPAVLFVIDGASYLTSALLIFFIRAGGRPRTLATPQEPPARVYDDMRAAAAYIWRKPGMRLVLIAAIPVSVFTETIIVFLSFYTTNALNEPLSYYAYLLTLFSVGSFIGFALTTKSTLQAAHRSLAVTGCLILSAAVCAGLVLVHTFWIAAVLLLCFGAFTGAVSLLCMNALILQTDSDKRGRVTAVLIMITQGVTPLAMSVLGIAVDLLSGDLRPLYAVCGLALLGVALTFSSSRDVQYFFGKRFQPKDMAL